jgi:hypothetical protein
MQRKLYFVVIVSVALVHLLLWGRFIVTFSIKCHYLIFHALSSDTENLMSFHKYLPFCRIILFAAEGNYLHGTQTFLRS